jgi:uncharacterized repeat protein (TIGR01451 family)
VLAPAATTTCAASYSLTQDDVDTGLVTNTATSSGTPPVGASVVSTPSDAAVTVTPSASISLVKSVDRSIVAGADQQVIYSFLVTNTGQSTLAGIAITDDLFTGTGTLPAAICPTTTLAPGASTTCTSSYRTTAGDVSARAVDNTATASAVSPAAAGVTSAPSSARITVDALAAVLAATGAAFAPLLMVFGLGFLVAGLVALAISVRRRILVGAE